MKWNISFFLSLLICVMQRGKEVGIMDGVYETETRNITKGWLKNIFGSSSVFFFSNINTKINPNRYEASPIQMRTSMDISEDPFKIVHHKEYWVQE